MADDLVMPERTPDEDLEQMIMPDGKPTLIPKTWSGDERRAFVEKKFPGAYDEPKKYDPPEGSWGYSLKDAGHALHDTIEEGVAAIPGLPGTLIELGKRGLRGLGMDDIVAEPELGSSKIPTGQDLLHEYRDLRGMDPESYQPKTEMGKLVAPFGRYLPGGVGGLATAVPRVMTNVVAPAVGEIAGGRLGEKFGMKEIGETVGALAGWGTAAGTKAIRSPRGVGLTDSEGLGNMVTQTLDDVDKAGVRVRRSSVRGFVDSLDTTAKVNRISSVRHPKALDVIRNVKKLMQPNAAGALPQRASLRDLYGMREDLATIAKSGDAQEALMGRRLRESFDEYLDGLKPNDVTNGNVKEGVEALTKFRKLYQRKKKTEMIEDMLDSAEIRAAANAGQDVNEIVKRKFTAFVDPQGAGARNKRSFTPAEWDMLKEVSMGRPLERTLRWVAQVSPKTLSGKALAALGYSQGGVEAAVAVAAPGSVSRYMANKMTKANAQRAYDSVRGGVPLSAPPSAGAAANIGTGSQMFPFDLPPIKDYGTSEEDDELMKRLKMQEEGQQ